MTVAILRFMMALSTVHSSDGSDTGLMMVLSTVHSSDGSDTAAHGGTEYCKPQ